MSPSTEFSAAECINALWLLTLWLALPLAAGLLLHRHSMRGERALLRVALISAPLAILCALWLAPHTTAFFYWSIASPNAADTAHTVIVAHSSAPRPLPASSHFDDASTYVVDDLSDRITGPCADEPPQARADEAAGADSQSQFSAQLSAELTREQIVEHFGGDVLLADELGALPATGVIELTIPSELLMSAAAQAAQAPSIASSREQFENLAPSAPLLSPTDGSGGAGLEAIGAESSLAARVLLGCWCAAAGWILLRLILAHFALRRFRDAWQPLDVGFATHARALAARVGYRRRFDVFTAKRLAEAVASGWWRPAVAIPSAWLARLSRRDIEPLLLHEIAHLKHRDPLWRSIAWLFSAALWPHPLLHWLIRREQRLSEEVADELTLAAGADRRHYAQLLGKLATERDFSALPSLASGTFGPRTHLEGRIRMILTQATQPAIRGSWAFTTFVCLACLALLGLAVAHPLVGTAQANDGARYQVEVRSQDGWWISEGRTPGADGKIVWTIRLAPTEPDVAASVERAGATAIVRVGDRKWSLAAETGQAEERVARRALSVDSAPVVSRRQDDLAAFDIFRQSATDFAASPCPPDADADPFASEALLTTTDSLGRDYSARTKPESKVKRRSIELRQKELSDRLRVMEERLARARLLQDAGTVSTHEIEEAELALGTARTNLELLEVELAASAPAPLPAPDPVAPYPPCPPTAATEPGAVCPPETLNRRAAPRAHANIEQAAREFAQGLQLFRSTHDSHLKHAIDAYEAAIQDLGRKADEAKSKGFLQAAHELSQQRAQQVGRLLDVQRNREQLARNSLPRQREHERSSQAARRTVEERMRQLEEELQSAREQHEATLEQLSAEHERQMRELERQMQKREREIERAVRELEREQERSLKQQERDAEEQSLDHEGRMHTLQERSEQSAGAEEESEASTREQIEALEEELRQLNAKLRRAERASRPKQPAWLKSRNEELECDDDDDDDDEMTDDESESEAAPEPSAETEPDAEPVVVPQVEVNAEGPGALYEVVRKELASHSNLTGSASASGANEQLPAAEQQQVAELAREIALIRETVQLVKESVKEKLRLRATRTDR